MTDRRPYHQILRCATDPHYIATPTGEDIMMLYRPLFWTSYWCEDWLFSSRYRDASAILISSASAKTAFCLAYLMKKRIAHGEVDPNTKIIGLTSQKNLLFTEQLGHYHEVFEYNTFTSAILPDQTVRWIYIDVAGNEILNQRILAHFGSPYTGSLAACISLGLTNVAPSTSSALQKWGVNSFSAAPSVPASIVTDETPYPSTLSFWAKFEKFFLVEWLDVRKHQISISEIFNRQNQAWKELAMDCIGWVKLERVYADRVRSAYDHAITNGLDPDRGQIWSLWNEPDTMFFGSKL